MKKKSPPLYIPKILADLMLATTRNSTQMHFGFGHMCQKHRKLFDLEHLRTCDQIEGCPDIERFAKRIKEGENIRDWEEEELLQCIAQYTSLAM